MTTPPDAAKLAQEVMTRQSRLGASFTYEWEGVALARAVIALTKERDALLQWIQETTISKYIAERDTPEEMEMYQCSLCAGEWPVEQGPLHKDDCLIMNPSVGDALLAELAALRGNPVPQGYELVCVGARTWRRCANNAQTCGVHACPIRTPGGEAVT